MPALIVPDEVEIEIELPPTGTELPWFWARMPTAAELTVTPDVVVTSIAPNVEIAEIPCDVVPMMVGPLPITMLSGPAPLV